MPFKPCDAAPITHCHVTESMAITERADKIQEILDAKCVAADLEKTRTEQAHLIQEEQTDLAFQHISQYSFHPNSGYGNTAPKTAEGRTLVFTCGFVTIVGFLALNNTASNVWKHLFEDIFERHNLTCLVRGPICVLFWLFMAFLWMLVIALSVQKCRRNRTGADHGDFPLTDAIWFSHITATTVGLGDFYLPHE